MHQLVKHQVCANQYVERA